MIRRDDITALLIPLLSIVILIPAISFADNIDALGMNDDEFMQHPKLKDAATLLTEIYKDARSVKVIVVLKNNHRTLHRQRWKMTNGWNWIQKDVREQMDKILSFDSMKNIMKNIKTQKRFLYITAFAAEVSADGLIDLLRIPEVESIEPNRILDAHVAQGISLVNAMAVRGVYKGQGVAVAVCDTGIDYTHLKLGGGGFPNDKVIGGFDFGGNIGHPSSQDADPMDQNGHGTACAGIIAGVLDSLGDYIGGVAPDAKLYALKISYGATGSAFESDMMDAWEWCITHRNDDEDYPIKVISTSFGSEKYTTACDGESPAMALVAENVMAAGIAIFVSSGNNGYCNSLAWPSCISSVISVGAVFDAGLGTLGFCVSSDSCAPNQGTYATCNPNPIAWAYNTQSDQVTPYSNVASFLDILAPSHSTKTTTIGGGYIEAFGGTSAACPYAAGVAACVQSAAKAVTGAYLSPAEIKDKLVNSGDLITYAAADIIKPRVNLGNIDIDGDGMPSGWEMSFFGNLLQNGEGDMDMDGLNNLGEFTNQTDPNDSDSDDDTYNDGLEVAAGTDPLDAASHPISVTSLSQPFLVISFFGLLFIGLKRMLPSTFRYHGELQKYYPFKTKHEHRSGR